MITLHFTRKTYPIDPLNTLPNSFDVIRSLLLNGFPIKISLLAFFIFERSLDPRTPNLVGLLIDLGNRGGERGKLVIK